MKKFNSLLGPDMESFLELKESLGYSRNTYQYQLGKIDEYAITNHPQLDVMNEAMVLGWASKRKGESNNGRRTRLFTIREFGKYQRGIGKHTYVLTTDYFDKPLNYIPYLFSDEELKLLFMAIDSLPANRRSPEIELVLPVLFRMMGLPANSGHLEENENPLQTDGELYTPRSNEVSIYYSLSL